MTVHQRRQARGRVDRHDIVPALLVGGVLLAMLAACGTVSAGGGGVSGGETGGGDSGSTGSPVAPGPPADGSTLWGEPFTAVECPAGDPQPLPADRTSVSAAHVCIVVQRAVAGDGTWAVGVVRRVTGGLPALLATYGTSPSATPSAPSGDVACAAIGYLPLTVWVVAGGRTVPVMEPRVGPCQSPDPAAVAAYRALSFTTVREVRLRRLDSQVAVTSGCDQSVKDVMAILAQGPVTAPAAGAPTPLDAASSAAAHACVYDRTQPVTGGAPEAATQEIDGTSSPDGRSPRPRSGR